MSGIKFDLFISYSHHDRDRVDGLLTTIRSQIQGLRVWIDHEQLTPGMDWADTILRSASSAAMVLIFGTECAFSSQWVQREIGIALSRRVLDNMPLILLVDNPNVVPPDLLRYQYIDYSNHTTGDIALIDFLRSDAIQRVRFHDSATAHDTIGFQITPSCVEKLTPLSQADLRYKIMKALSRNQIAEIWGDVLEERMDDEIPNQPKGNCALELLLRSKGTTRRSNLFRILCRNFPELADIPVD